jgi:hypothetical protein
MSRGIRRIDEWEVCIDSVDGWDDAAQGVVQVRAIHEAHGTCEIRNERQVSLERLIAAEVPHLDSIYQERPVHRHVEILIEVRSRAENDYLVSFVNQSFRGCRDCEHEAAHSIGRLIGWNHVEDTHSSVSGLHRA